jgi:hypothetical protein
LRSAWATWQVQGQSEQQSKTLSQKNQKPTTQPPPPRPHTHKTTFSFLSFCLSPFLAFCFFIEPRASQMLCNSSTSELHSQAQEMHSVGKQSKFEWLGPTCCSPEKKEAVCADPERTSSLKTRQRGKIRVLLI